MPECQQQPRLWVELRLHLAADLCWCFTSLWTDDYASLHKNSDLVTFQLKKHHLQLFKFDFFWHDRTNCCSVHIDIWHWRALPFSPALFYEQFENGRETHNQSVSANKTCHSHCAGLVWRRFRSKHNLVRLLTSLPERECGFSMMPCASCPSTYVTTVFCSWFANMILCLTVSVNIVWKMGWGKLHPLFRWRLETRFSEMVI